MKKIKKKKSASTSTPAFLIGWTHGEPPPPGYISAWFDQNYGGPLRIRFLSSSGHHHFEARHTNWNAEIHLEPSSEIVERWQGRVQWDHARLALILSGAHTNTDRRDAVLHWARMARAVTLLTDGTSYDVEAGAYLNPSDWRDRDLLAFQLTDHVQVEQREDFPRGQMWFHTRGMTKFGLDEIETFLPIGLAGRGVEDMIFNVAGRIIEQGKNPKVEEQLLLDGDQKATVVRHRTDPLYGIPLAFREFRWD